MPNTDLSRQRIAVTLTAALLVHVGVALLWPQSTQKGYGSDIPATLVLSLVQPKPPVKKSDNEPQPEVKGAAKPEARESKTVAQPKPQRTEALAATRTVTKPKMETSPPTPANEPKTRKTVTTQPQANEAQQQAEAAPLTTAQRQQRILHHLKQQFSPHFSYPLMARRHGWQGEVILHIHLQLDGRIGRVEVAQSSGYPLLDSAAVEAVNELGRVAGIDRWLDSSVAELHLPVIYQLRGG